VSISSSKTSVLDNAGSRFHRGYFRKIGRQLSFRGIVRLRRQGWYLIVFSDRWQGFFGDRRGRLLHRCGCIVLLPLLVGKPGQEPESRPYQHSLIIH
jgi:hypothetical protein